MRKKYTKEELEAEASKYPTKKEFLKGSKNHVKAARRMGIYVELIKRFPDSDSFPWKEYEIFAESEKHPTRTEFWKKARGAAKAAIRLGIYDKISSRWPNPINKKRSDEELFALALTCKTKTEFSEKYPTAKVIIYRRKIQNIAFAHMPDLSHPSGKDNPNYKYTDEHIHQVALKYTNIDDFRKNDYKIYDAAHDRGIYPNIIAHMPPASNDPYSFEELRDEALKYPTRRDFYINSWKVYAAASARGILDDICRHMKKSQNVSFMEEDLCDALKEVYPELTKLRDRRVKISGKSHIKGFDIDIFLKERNLGIEFDGDYYHSYKGLKRNKKKWPDEDIHNYHEIKDSWFLSKGIKILHVKECDWLADREACIKRCLDFLKS